MIPFIDGSEDYNDITEIDHIEIKLLQKCLNFVKNAYFFSFSILQLIFI